MIERGSGFGSLEFHPKTGTAGSGTNSPCSSGMSSSVASILSHASTALCCLIPETTYSALEVRVDSDDWLVVALRFWSHAASTEAVVVVLAAGVTVVSMPVPASSRRSPFNSIATSLIV